MATQLDRKTKKEIVSIIREELLQAICRLPKVSMEQKISNTEALTLFKEEVLRSVQCIMSKQGLLHLVKIVDWGQTAMLWIEGLIGGVLNAYNQTPEKARESLNLQALGTWDTLWNVAKAKNKCVSKELTEFGYAHNKARAAFAISEKVACGSAHIDVNTKEMDVHLNVALLSTSHVGSMSQMTYISDASIYKEGLVGEGAFGQAYKVNIKGVPGLLDFVTYIGKCYTGPDGHQVTQARREYLMQIVHPVLVRVIAGTRMKPLWSIMPYFNGGTLGEMLRLLPYRMGRYTRFLDAAKGGHQEKVHKRFKGDPSLDSDVTKADVTKISKFCLAIPSLIHALVLGMKSLHDADWLHNDIHAANIVLDWTSSTCRVGIIDWGMALDATENCVACKRLKREINETTENWQRRLAQEIKRRRAREWKAPELRDPLIKVLCRRDHDVYAMGWIIVRMCEFFEDSASLYGSSPDKDLYVKVDLIRNISKWVQGHMMRVDASSRSTFYQVDDFLRRFNFHPEKAMRPLHEMELMLKYGDS